MPIRASRGRLTASTPVADSSGVPVERDAVWVYPLRRRERVDRVDIFGTKAEALEAAGLSE